MRALPGVKSAAYISFLPMTMSGGIWPVTRRRPRRREPNEREHASLRFVTPGFFATIGMPLRVGRDVARLGRLRTTRRRSWRWSANRSRGSYWPGQDPIGRRFNFAFFERTVVGVVGDVRVRGLERDSEPQVYLPAAQVTGRRRAALRAEGPGDSHVRDDGGRDAAAAAALMPAVREIIARADPEQPISDVQPLADIVAAETAPRVAQVRVLGAFAAHRVPARRHRHPRPAVVRGLAPRARRSACAWRSARGAATSSAWCSREGLTLAVIGVIAGVALAYAAGRSLEALLAGVTPWRPADVRRRRSRVSLAMTIAGSLLPALRAVRVDPLVVMRVE